MRLYGRLVLAEAGSWELDRLWKGLTRVDRSFVGGDLGRAALGQRPTEEVPGSGPAVKASQDRPGRPVGPATVKDVLEMLRTALNDAVRQRKLDVNPANGVELASYSTPEAEP